VGCVNTESHSEELLFVDFALLLSVSFIKCYIFTNSIIITDAV